MTQKSETKLERLEIIFRDEHFVAVNKPAGLLVHRSPVAAEENTFALQMVRDMVGQRVYPVHRLDRPTSGVLLFALTPEAAAQTAHLFCSGAVVKKYIAVVRGYIDEDGTIDHPLAEVRDRRINRGDDVEPQKAYPATTDYKRLATIELPYAVDRYPTSRYSLAALWPKTGRRHQLRRHLKHIAHPIIGDTTYGKAAHNLLFKQQFNCSGLLLTAVELAFRHPLTGEDLVIAAPCSAAVAALLKKFGWDDFMQQTVTG